MAVVGFNNFYIYIIAQNFSSDFQQFKTQVHPGAEVRGNHRHTLLVGQERRFCSALKPVVPPPKPALSGAEFRVGKRGLGVVKSITTSV